MGTRFRDGTLTLVINCNLLPRALLVERRLSNSKVYDSNPIVEIVCLGGLRIICQ